MYDSVGQVELDERVDVGPSAARMGSPGRAVAIEPPLCGRLLHRTNGQEVIRSEVARCSWLVPLLKAARVLAGQQRSSACQIWVPYLKPAFNGIMLIRLLTGTFYVGISTFM